MALPYTFGPLTAAQMAYLDSNFAAVGALGIIPCTITGTNALTLTPNANTPTVSAYANYQRFAGIIAAPNSGAVTARVGGLAFLNVYVDTISGPVALSAANSLITNNIVTLGYDSALNAGTGGFHLLSSLPVDSFLDLISSSTGAMLYRTSVSWTGLAVGSVNYVLNSNGTIPQWSSPSGYLDSAFTASVGALVMRGTAGWTGLQPGASGTALTSQGPGSVLVWV